MFCSEIHQEMASQREALGLLVRRLDPDSVPASQAPGLWGELDRMARQVAAAKALLARRVEDSLVWKREGFRSAAEYLAARGGTSLGAARSELETSKALPSLPATRTALLEGTVSIQQGALIADAAIANPAAEQHLVTAAGRHSFGELRDHARRAKAAGDPDPEATQRRIHRHRRLREFVDGEGAWHLQVRGTVADGARVHAALAPVIDEVFEEHRRSEVHEPGEAYAFDALVRLAERIGSAGACGRTGRYLGLIRCDLSALQRGRAAGDELCEVTGLGPVSVSQAIEILGDATWKLVLTKGEDVAHVTTLSRQASAAMVAALAWRSPVCSVEGCGRTLTQIDHRLPFAATRHTTLSELDPLCKPHHDLKTYEGWELAPGTGIRPFRPPGGREPPDPSRG
jgi:hypothetical protein